MCSALCKCARASKWCIFARELNILEFPKYALSFILEREKAPFASAEERRKSGAEMRAEQ